MKKIKRLPKSIRKYIRREKSRIRREILDLARQREEIRKIYERLQGLAKKKLKEYIKNNGKQKQGNFSESEQRADEIGQSSQGNF